MLDSSMASAPAPRPSGSTTPFFPSLWILTEAGYAQWPQVTGTLFAAIERLRAEGPQRWRYDEQARLAALAFAYQPQRDAYNTVSALAAGLLKYRRRKSSAAACAWIASTRCS